MVYDVNFDFDDASTEWRKNKKYKGKGKFVYICHYIHSNGKQCRRTIYSNLMYNPYADSFNNFEFWAKNKNHPNKDIFCKKHLNRKKNEY